MRSAHLHRVAKASSAATRFDHGLQPFAEAGVAVSAVPATQRLRHEEWLVVSIYGLIAIAGMIAFGRLPASHFPRVLGAMLLTGVGLVAGVGVARRKWVRVLCLGAALALAVLVWFFMPTTRGMNWWTARHETHRLADMVNALPDCDVAAFLAGRDDRDRFMSHFPEFRAPVQEAVDAWQQRSVSQWQVELERLDVADLPSFQQLRERYDPFFDSRLEEFEIAWLDRAWGKIPAGDFQAVQKVRALSRSSDAWVQYTRGWEATWADRTAQAAIAQTEPLLAVNPALASARLRQTTLDLRNLMQPGTLNRLLAARRRAYLNHWDKVRNRVREDILAERYQAAARNAKQFQAETFDEAKLHGVDAEVVGFQKSCDFWPALARVANKPDPK